MSIISSLPAIYRYCRSDYLGFEIGFICHGLAVFGLGLGLAFFGLGLELCGLVNITGSIMSLSVCQSVSESVCHTNQVAILNIKEM